MRVRLLEIVALLIALVGLGGVADAESGAVFDSEMLSAALSRPIIDRKLPLEEVQAFTDARVARLDQPTSADEWRTTANDLRQRVLDEVIYQGEAARWRDAAWNVEWLETIEGGPGYRIRKLRYEAVPGLWIPALLYEPENLTGRVPVVMNVNGHDGDGKAAEYKQIRCINQAKRGMIVLNVEWLGMGQLRTDGFEHYKMNQLDLCGTSGLAPFYLSMKRGLDILLAHENADPKRVAVAGLSGGGWQTIIISALDPRVTLANPVAGYSSYRTRVFHQSDLGDSEQTPVDLGGIADYAHLTAMMAPRGLLLTYNTKDQCCFQSGYALQPLLDAAAPVYGLFGKQNHLAFHINEDPGTHNFERDNREALYDFMGRVFYSGDSNYSALEIDCAGELKTKEQLDVPLPEKNLDFNQLALAVSKNLPRQKEIEDADAARQRLREVLRAPHYEVLPIEVGGESRKSFTSHRFILAIGGEWSVPAVLLEPDGANGTVILLGDKGRAALAADAAAILAEGKRVLAIDPFYFGESKIDGRDFLYAILVSGVGERPLGIQAAQLGAAARWVENALPGQSVSVSAVGPRTSLIALTAAALEPAIGVLDLRDSHSSLKQVIEQNIGVNQMPEIFCFGLLEQFDIPQLKQLAAPRPVRIH